MSLIKQVEDMPVYQRFYQLAIRVEECTRHFAGDFLWLRIQALKSSESVAANMSEGFYSQYITEYLQCLYRCRREARETVTHIRYAGDVTLLSPATAGELRNAYDEALEELSRLIASIERKVRARGKAKPGAVREQSSAYAFTPSTINHQPSTIHH